MYSYLCLYVFICSLIYILVCLVASFGYIFIYIQTVLVGLPSAFRRFVIRVPRGSEWARARVVVSCISEA